MKTARALAFPSRAYETFGMSLIEAMSAGLPVIAPVTGAAAEVIGASAGWRAASSDPQAWAEALSNTHNADAVDTAGRAARTRWQDRFSAAANLPRLESAYLSARRLKQQGNCSGLAPGA